jgi:hypothetical protein
VCSLAELNEMVEQWNRQDDIRRIGARSQTVAEYFALEQPLLMPLPEGPFETGRLFTPGVDRAIRASTTPPPTVAQYGCVDTVVLSSRSRAWKRATSEACCSSGQPAPSGMTQH